MFKKFVTILMPVVFALCVVACDSKVDEQVATESSAGSAPDPIHIISSFTEAGSSSRTIRVLAPSIEAYFERPVEIHYNPGGKCFKRFHCRVCPFACVWIALGTSVEMVPFITDSWISVCLNPSQARLCWLPVTNRIFGRDLNL